MLKNGLDLAYAERIFHMIQGFGGYGFPESHAASFALIGYASCYLKRYHPAAFLAGLLNSQPMGFYGTSTLVADAQRHGVEVRPPCILKSAWDSLLEGRGRAVRIGFREIHGMSEAQADRIVRVRSEAPLSSLADIVARAELPRDVTMRLAAAGAFAPLGLSRREALWKAMALDRESPLFEGIDLPDEPGISERLPKMDLVDEMRADYEVTGLTVGPHPMALVRELMERKQILGFKEIQTTPHGARVRTGGMVVTRQRPGTASGVVFITLEDEDGHINLVVFSHVYDRYRELARDGTMLIAEGKLERTGKVINVVVDRFERLDDAPEPGVPVSRNFF
jgi:error-prone DNA polymerase